MERKVGMWVGLGIFAELLVLPILVYSGSSIANITGLPFDTGCLPYDAASGAITSVIIGLPLACVVYGISFIPAVKRKVSPQTILYLFGTVVMFTAVFIIYESDWCK